MIRPMLAHAGGIDEMAIFLFPIVIGLGFWLLTRQRKPADDEGESGRPDDGATEDEPTRISERRKDGATRPPSLMDAQLGSDGRPDPRAGPPG